MTRRLEQAFETLGKLPEAEQNRYAESLLEQLESDRAWNESSTNHAPALRRLADKAIRDEQAGNSDNMPSD